MLGRVGTMSLATSCDITRHHAIGSGSGSGAGGVRCHSTEGVAEESRGGGSGSGSGRRARVRSGSGRRVGVGSGRGSPYKHHQCTQMGTLVVFGFLSSTPTPPSKQTRKRAPYGRIFVSAAYISLSYSHSHIRYFLFSNITNYLSR